MTPATQHKLDCVRTLCHHWQPDDGCPVIGVNEGADKTENPYLVIRTIRYEHGLFAPVIIPRKFATDLGSIPWLLKIIPGFRPTDPGRRAFLLHDWCYRKQLEDRRIVDELMYAALVADGMTRWQAWVCWLGVRCFGGKAWKTNARKKAANANTPNTT